jgi:tetratricopeptide (TPR) repeat protein
MCWHKRGYKETGKEWSDWDIVNGRNPNITCHDLALEYLYKGENLFSYLYDINPVQYANGLSTAYLMLGEREEELGNFYKAIEFYEKIESLYFNLPNDTIDRNSGIHKAFLECYEKMANLYMRQDNFDKALYFYRTATQLCEKLSEKKYIEYFYMLISSCINEARAYGALGKYEIGIDIIFITAYDYIGKLSEIDHHMKFSCWDDWFEIVAIYRQNIFNMTRDGLCSMEILEEFVDKAITIMEHTWTNEVISIGTTRLDLLMQDFVRGVYREGIEEYVIEGISNFSTIITRAAIEEANYLIFSNRKDHAIGILKGRLAYFQGLFQHFDPEKNVYLDLVLNNDMRILKELIKRFCDDK